MRTIEKLGTRQRPSSSPRRWKLGLLVGCVTFGTTTKLASAEDRDSLKTVPMHLGEAGALSVTHAPGDDTRLFTVSRRGQIWAVRNGGTSATLFLDIQDQVEVNGESGLLGFAFHPDYANNGFFYLYYTPAGQDGDVMIARAQVSDDDPEFADANLVPVLPLPAGGYTTLHFAGWLGFGLDGFLYIASGDRDGESSAGRVTDNLFGKILRIDVDGDDFPNDPDRNYAVPPGNPFVGIDGDDEIWAFGLRNPWRCSIDPATGDLFIADVGENSFEEINVLAADAGGADFGWPCREAYSVFRESKECDQRSMTDPIYAYEHTSSPRRCAIVGGEVYRGCQLDGFDGAYFFADFCSAEYWALFRDPNGGEPTIVDLTEELESNGQLAPGLPVSFGRDARGEILSCNDNWMQYFVPAAGLSIDFADPPPPTVDARRPSLLSGDMAPRLRIGFDQPAACVSPLAFSVYDHDLGTADPTVSAVEHTGENEVVIVLDRPLVPQTRTTVLYMPSDDSIDFYALPGDVNGDGVSGAPDIIALIDAINGVGPQRSIWSTDIDRNGTTAAPDITALIDLLNGANGQQPWLGARIR